jgi:flavodoxin
MSSVTFDQLAQKFELLPDQAKKEAYDFIEFLLQKKTARKKKKVDKKKILLGMSCWDDEDTEKHFTDVVQRSYNGNVQAAITSLLKLHEKYSWKEQLSEDVESIRKEVRRKGGVRSKDIEQAIKMYRNNIAKSDA